MRIDTRIIKSLGEYMDCMRGLAHNDMDQHNVSPSVLWFRGISDVGHSLIPSLFRDDVRINRTAEEQYSSLHYAEDIRTQHYIAKNYHFFQKEPSSRVEWLEVMQHHEMKTRVLDWSESSIHSLLFAIEPFLDNKRYSEQKRRESVPCVWVLEPGRLNRRIFQHLVTEMHERGLVCELLEELTQDSAEKGIIIDTMKKMSVKLYHETKESSHIDYILNLSAINDEILRDRSRMKYLLMNGDVMNPLYYIIGRIYSDGYILEKRTLPPLAVVHPYHSERIKAQKGVFTVFPFYEEQPIDKIIREFGINPDAMDNNALAADCLHRIIINNPRDVAYDLLANGTNDSWLYPEMPIVSSEIENHKVYY